MDHERDSELMAMKLTQMKMDMMENESEYGIRRKYGAVKVSGERLLSCTLEITEVKGQHYLLIDSAKSELNILFEHIDQMVYVETSQSIKLIYFVP
jgi:hypothetical protein